MAAPTKNREQLLEAARSVSPIVTREAELSEFQRALTKPVVDAFKEKNLFDVMLPEVLGGAEADPVTQALVFEEISRQDASAGWCLMASATSNACAAAFNDDAAVAEMFEGKTNVALAGQAAPVGKAVVERGGYRVSGHWQFGSGIDHADWVIAGCIVYEGEQPRMTEFGVPEMRIVCMDPADASLIGNWDVMGLQGTGSQDYVATDLHVPEGYTFQLTETTPRRGGDLYKLGMIGLVASGHASFAIGVARRALDEITAMAPRRERGGELLSDKPTFQRDLAQAEAKLRAARLLVLDSLDQTWDAIANDREYDQHLRAGVRLASNHAHDVASEVVTFAYKAAGTTSLRAPNALERCFRDIHAATQHAFVGEGNWLQSAQVLMGTAGPMTQL